MGNGYGQVVYIKQRITGDSSAGEGIAFDALVPWGSRNQLAIVKLFDPQTKPKGAFNELAAFSVYERLGAPAAPVRPVYCATKLVIPHLQKFELAPWRGLEHIFCIAPLKTREAIQRTTALSSPLLEEELVGWADMGVTIVADEILLNSDRTPQNILRVREKRFVLIDHEKIMRGPNWGADDLKHYQDIVSPQNYLARILLKSSNQVGKRRLFAQCKQVSGGLALDVRDFLPNIEEVTGAPAGTLKALIECANARSRKIEDLIGRQAILAQELFDITAY